MTNVAIGADELADRRHRPRLETVGRDVDDAQHWLGGTQVGQALGDRVDPGVQGAQHVGDVRDERQRDEHDRDEDGDSARRLATPAARARDQPRSRSCCTSG